ncbi:MAG: hypothetical protein HKP38_00425, partial [Croceitalea sp.]|nr:hypothetical protein [Croceitalea sp.]
MLKRQSVGMNRFMTMIVLLLFALGTSAQDSIVADTSLESYFKEARFYRHQNKLSPALEALDKAAKTAEKEENLKALLD